MPEFSRIYLCLGSNLGERAENLEQAIAALAGAGVRVRRRSAIYETEPVDFLDQPVFLNCVLEAETSLPPSQLLKALQGIERQMGSKKLIARGPRLIDLDVIFYASLALRTPEIEIPHPRMGERRFVLVPLAELAPKLVHPVLHCTVTELLEKTRDRSGVKSWEQTGGGTRGK